MAKIAYQHLNPPLRILMGPGPSNVHPRVQQAMAAPMVGHLDPYFVTIMDETVELLRYLFRTQNRRGVGLSADQGKNAVDLIRHLRKHFGDRFSRNAGELL